jgi:polyisoprenoid-binding protein YceI
MSTMTSVTAGTWTVDLTRTRAAFAARHLFGQTVHGTIAVTGGTIEVSNDGRAQRLHATLDPASIDTGHARRDSDLRGKRFLAVDSFPLLEVIADRIVATADGWYAVATLRCRGYQAPLHIDATLEGSPTVPRLLVSSTARLDLRAVGIRVPRFLVRRFVDLSVSARLTRQT